MFCNYYVDENGFFGKFEFVYKVVYSFEMVLLKIKDDILLLYDNGKVVVLFFFDLDMFVVCDGMIIRFVFYVLG